MMSDSQDEASSKVPTNYDLMPGEKMRLRAALQILVEHLIENGYLSQSHTLLEEIHESDQIIPDVTSALSQNDT